MRRNLRRFWCGPGLGTILVAALLLGSGCQGTGGNASEEEASEIVESPNNLSFNPNVRIGEVIWQNEAADFVVVQMDSPRADFQPAFFLALDEIGSRISGVLVGGGGIQGRSFGARIVEGVAPVGSEIRIPSQEWTEYLYNRYNRSARVPVPQDGAGAGR